MKKNTKLLVISASIVALLGAALAAVLLIPSNNEELTLSDKNEILLFDKSGLIPEEISVSNSGGAYELLAFDTGEISRSRSSTVSAEESTETESQTESESEEDNDITLVYTMQDHPELRLDKNVTDDLVRQCLTQSAREIVDKSGSKYKEYGLEPAIANVRIRYSDGSFEELQLGNDAPGGEGIYMKTGSSRNVYLVQSSLANTFYIEKLQLFDKQVTPYIEDITRCTLSGENYSEDIEFRKNNYDCYDSYHVMTKPARYPCDTNMTNQLTSSLSELKAIWVADINVAKDDLQRFGLDKPYEKIYIEADNGLKFTLIASKPDKDKNFYLMNTADTTVFSTSMSESDWYGIKKTDLLYSSILTFNSDRVEKATIKAGEASYEFKYEKEEGLSSNYYKTELITVYCNGNKINSKGISTYLLNLTALTWTDTTVESTDGLKEILSVEIDYDADEDGKDTLVLMREPSGKTVAVLNGRAECYVDSTIADQLVSQTSLLSLGDELPSLLNDDGYSSQQTSEQASTQTTQQESE